LSETKFTLENLITKGRNYLSLPLTLPNLQGNGNYGILEVRGEEMVHHRGYLKGTVSYKSLLKSVLSFTQPTHSLTFSRINEGGSRTMVYRLSGLKGWEVEWSDVVLEIQKLCNTDYERDIEIAVFTSAVSASSTAVPVGLCRTTVKEILELSNESNKNADKCLSMKSPTNKIQSVGELRFVCEDSVLSAPTYLDVSENYFHCVFY
jgi:hypothetical protein